MMFSVFFCSCVVMLLGYTRLFGVALGYREDDPITWDAIPFIALFAFVATAASALFMANFAGSVQDFLAAAA